MEKKIHSCKITFASIKKKIVYSMQQDKLFHCSAHIGVIEILFTLGANILILVCVSENVTGATQRNEFIALSSSVLLHSFHWK